MTTETFEVFKEEIRNMKHASILYENYPHSDCSPNLRINKKRGACLDNSFSLDSGPMGLQYASMNHTISTGQV